MWYTFSKAERGDGMEDRIGAVFDGMVRFDAGDARRIQHFVKVHAFARRIGLREGLDAETLARLEVVALTHDIGIRIAEAKYGSCTGPQQEEEGPPAAAELLAKLGFEKSFIERVCFLIGHHHSYDAIDAADFQILVEADFLVNLHEGDMSAEAVRHAYDAIFRTGAGRELCRVMFNIP
jgi:HD superfamily phosphodiesterase